ncbi:hypothetical protein STEG23_013552, partial [Scotinomys teguina]
GAGISSTKQEPEGPSRLTKFSGYLSMGPAYPVDTTFCQAIQASTVSCPNGYFCQEKLMSEWTYSDSQLSASSVLPSFLEFEAAWLLKSNPVLDFGAKSDFFYSNKTKEIGMEDVYRGEFGGGSGTLEETSCQSVNWYKLSQNMRSRALEISITGPNSIFNLEYDVLFYLKTWRFIDFFYNVVANGMHEAELSCFGLQVFDCVRLHLGKPKFFGLGKNISGGKGLQEESLGSSVFSNCTVDELLLRNQEQGPTGLDVRVRFHV